jgi:hypothetical protein
MHIFNDSVAAKVKADEASKGPSYGRCKRKKILLKFIITGNKEKRSVV